MNQARPPAVAILTAAGVFDILLAIVFAATPVLSSQIGQPLALAVAAALAAGGVVLIAIARRRARPKG